MSSSSLQDFTVAPKGSGDEPDADYSCYFTIFNSFTDKPLILEDFGAKDGAWVGEPPQVIRANTLSTVMRFYGSSGFVSYGVDLDEGHVIITATIACPFTSDNTATFKADNPKLVSASVGPFSKDGHPLTVGFTAGPI